MARHIQENERVKWEYMDYLDNAKGRDQKTIDKAMASIRRFEESTGYKPFKKFHRLQASNFKDHLQNAKNKRTGKPLGVTTIDADLRFVQGFFHWLVRQCPSNRNWRLNCRSFGEAWTAAPCSDETRSWRLLKQDLCDIVCVMCHKIPVLIQCPRKP